MPLTWGGQLQPEPLPSSSVVAWIDETARACCADLSHTAWLVVVTGRSHQCQLNIDQLANFRSDVLKGR